MWTKEKLLALEKANRLTFVKKKFYKISEIAEKFKLHRDKISRMIKAGIIKTKTIKTYRGHSRMRIIGSLKNYECLQKKVHLPLFCKNGKLFRQYTTNKYKIAVVGLRLKVNGIYTTTNDIDKSYIADLPKTIKECIGRDIPIPDSEILKLKKKELKILNILSDSYSTGKRKTQTELARLCGITRSTLLYHSRKNRLIQLFLQKLHTSLKFNREPLNCGYQNRRRI
ncbi:MAG: hypothetical protein A2017_17245 [Lentisphaerae bacterium GWF2_44_16]|nr:MAG: hypothetical protein A2017_17245 [Lentisphaerae bacterium GWF2_44_16]